MSEDVQAEEVTETTNTEGGEVTPDAPIVLEDQGPELDELPEDYLEQDFEKVIAEAQAEEEGEAPVEETPVATEPEPTETPAEPVTEETPAPELPEFMRKYEGEVDLENEALVDAINFWGGGPRAEWTLHNVHEMPEDKQAVFKSVQSAYGKHQDETRKASMATPVFTKEEQDQAVEKLARLLQGDQEVIDEYKGMVLPKEPKKAEHVSDTPIIKQDLVAKIKETFESGDADQFAAVLSDVVADVAKNTLEKAGSLAESKVTQGVQERLKELKETQWAEERRREATALIDSEGSAFTQYAVQGGPIERLLYYGDPMTGKAVETVQEAYTLCKKYSAGVKPVVSRPSPTTRTNSPASEASEPTIEEIMNSDRSLDEQMQMVAERTFLKST